MRLCLCFSRFSTYSNVNCAHDVLPVDAAIGYYQKCQRSAGTWLIASTLTTVPYVTISSARQFLTGFPPLVRPHQKQRRSALFTVYVLLVENMNYLIQKKRWYRVIFV